MRIGFIADELYPGFGGQATATEGHIAAMHARGHEVRVLAGQDKRATSPPDGVTCSRVPVMPLGNLSHMAWPTKRVIADLVSWADIVQINLPFALGVRSAAMMHALNKPVVMGFHIQKENTSLHVPVLRPAVERVLLGYYRWAFKKADCVIAPTPFAQRIVQHDLHHPNAKVLSNGLKLLPVTPELESKALTLRQTLLKENGTHLLVYVGRMYPEKHPEALLDTLKRLHEKGHTGVALALAGRGPLVESLQQRAHDLGIAHAYHSLGFISEEKKRLLLLASDVYMIASEAELQSIATLEAIAHGCAVLAAAYPSSAVVELIEGGKCGVGYPPGDTEHAAHLLAQWFDEADTLHNLKQQGLHFIKQHDMVYIAQQLEGIYEGLLEQSHPISI